jgi:hypothetical protein
VLNAIRNTKVGTHPFHHCYIEEIFPAKYYEDLRAHMLHAKATSQLRDRKQDNPAFVTRRHKLLESRDLIVLQMRAVFDDPEIKAALFSKFYLNPDDDVVTRTRIFQEFEYVFCEPDRFQNIHVDIPPKAMSFVFYIPEKPVSAEEEERNATVLYDKALEPQYAARFRANSVCIFVPHFYSYHGFASTMERDVLVMFYVHEGEMQRWRNAERKSTMPVAGMLDLIEAKLKEHPLIEYGTSTERLAAERAACRINAPKGRVLKN